MPKVRRQHHMPFGAELTDAGAVRFRLWAPAARQVELILYHGDGAQVMAMPALDGGWFGRETDAAPAGTLYRYRIDGELEVADPASRANPRGVHGPSAVVDPAAFEWDDGHWQPPPWNAAVIYELHVGTFTAAGTFAAMAARLEHLVRLGVTAIELMPLAAFPGSRGWGYDGVLQYAPQACYGTPEQLKALIAAAHHAGLAVLLDVVYNHFGPEGNYLHRYAPQFFNERHATPWGPAINFDGPASATVREFFIHNALYWLQEYHFDGLRLDAVHAIHDDGSPHIVNALAHAARAGAGQERTRYLTLENLDNAVRFLGPAGAAATCDAQWNDDAHHCLHVLLTGESAGYYADYCAAPQALLGRSLAEGFAYQGERSAYLGAPRGQPSAQLPPGAFINFLQNHDQIGNRARGERLTALVNDAAALRAAAAVLLLAPAVPMLFMGEEWGAVEPFPWFCDFEPELAARVFESRSREFPGSADPGAAATYAAARLEWRALENPAHAATLDFHRRLLAIRRREIAPLLPGLRAGRCLSGAAATALVVEWPAAGQRLRLIANLGAAAVAGAGSTSGRVLFATHPQHAPGAGELPPWSVIWLLDEPHAAR
jgi:maltooligosyltrehalose trehalohydrolase